MQSMQQDEWVYDEKGVVVEQQMAGLSLGPSGTPENKTTRPIDFKPTQRDKTRSFFSESQDTLIRKSLTYDQPMPPPLRTLR